jgi:hypothetical protein
MYRREDGGFKQLNVKLPGTAQQISYPQFVPSGVIFGARTNTQTRTQAARMFVTRAQWNEILDGGTP